MPPVPPATIALTLLAAALGCAALIVLMLPLLRRYALARPNARSSHVTPTPQGAGIAVVLATLVVAGIAIGQGSALPAPVLILFVATAGIALIGAVDDIRPLGVGLRLAAQALAVGAVLWALPADLRALPVLPLWAERLLLLVAGLWFVNLVNFMDGLDWMTVAEVVPVTAALVILGLTGDLSAPAALVAAALGGAMLGFAPFNKPVAKVFLGDVGSLPIGLLLGWCLIDLASHGHLAAALLLPLYYLADATVTLLRRMAKRERFWAAHRSHFYQRATVNGYTVPRVIGEVAMLNAILAFLAIVAVFVKTPTGGLAMLLLGAAAVGAVLVRFSRPLR